MSSAMFYLLGALQAATSRSSNVTEEEEAAIRIFLPNSVTLGTADNYSAAFKKWNEYLGSLSGHLKSDLYLEKVPDDYERSKRVVLFMVYLYTEKGLRDEQINRAVTGVAFQFSVAGLPTDFFRSEIVSRARKAGVRSTTEARALEVKRLASVKLPVFLELVWKVRDMYWVEKQWDAKGMDSKAIWLIIALGFDSGPRISNLTLRDGKRREDHCIRAGHTAFIVNDPASKMEYRIKGGPMLANFLNRADVKFSDVRSVDLTYITSKTSKKVKSVVTHPKTIARESIEESTVLDDLLSWIQLSGVLEEDELMTRYDPKNGVRKVVIRKVVKKAIQAAALFFGLPIEHFSCKSLRSGFGTHAKANGMSSSDVNQRGGWAKGSTVPEEHYVRDMHSRGALALSTSACGSQRHGIDEIRRMLPALSVVSSKQA